MGKEKTIKFAGYEITLRRAPKGQETIRLTNKALKREAGVWVNDKHYPFPEDGSKLWIELDMSPGFHYDKWVEFPKT
jgi:hypothetical protein